MKIVWFSYDEVIMYGIIDECEFVVLVGDLMFVGYEIMGVCVLLVDVVLFVLVILWLKVVCVGKNYYDYVVEMGGVVLEEFLLFFKLNIVVIGLGDMIVCLMFFECIEYEGEFVVVIGKIVKNVKVENVFDYVFGYMIGNDVMVCDL